MSIQTVIQFIEDLKRDDSLGRELRSTMEAAEDPAAALMEFAAERGHTFTEEELRAALDRVAMADGQLSDEDLESVAGGKGKGSGGSTPGSPQKDPLKGKKAPGGGHSAAGQAISGIGKG